MATVLHLSEKHGIVCPRTNNGTIQTFPFNHTLAPELSYKLWVDYHKILCNRFHLIPTAVGFCMLVKTILFQRYGLFSHEYGFGYNEENDFSQRINKRDIQ